MMADIIRLAGHVKEHRCRLWLQSKGYNIFGPDWITEKDGNYLIIEVKNKTQPYDSKKDPSYNGLIPLIGHGLDYRQVKTRMKMFKDTNIPTKLIIFDDLNKKIYWQLLHVLDASPKIKKYYLPKGKIQVYDLSLFEKEDYNETI